MKNGRPTPTTLYILLWSFLFLLAACRDKAEPVSQTTFTPSATFTAVPATPTNPTNTPEAVNTAVSTTAIPEPTPTPTNHLTTAEATISLRPSATPQPTATSRPTIPSFILTPATPTVANYSLKPWTVEEADNLANLMLVYQDRLGVYFDSNITRETDNRNYRYAAAAYQEALLRFPEDPRREYWQLGQAVMMAFSEDPNSGDFFQELLLDAFNKGTITPSEIDITNWLAQYPSRFSIQFEEIPPPDGFSGSYLVAIKSDYQIGGVTFWLLENPEGFSAQIIHDNLGDPYSSSYGFSIHPLLSKDASNVVLTIGSHNGTNIAANHIVYDLSQPVLIRLDFGPHYPVSFSFRHGIGFDEIADGREQIIVQYDEADWCYLLLTSRYEWNGAWFEPVSDEAEFIFEPTAMECLLNWLTFRYDRLLNTNSAREAVLSSFEETFPGAFDEVRPCCEDPLTSEPLEPDALDEFRFYLALNHAILGNVEQARDYLQRIIDTPVIEESRWISPTQIFLARYTSSDDLYAACMISAPDICPLEETFIQSISALPPSAWPEIQSTIVEWGAAIAAAGAFDFDQDGENERWLALRHQSGQPLEFWVFSPWDKGWQAIYVDDIEVLPVVLQMETFDPTREYPFIRYADPSFDHTLFSINGTQNYSFFRHPTTGEAFVRRSYYYPSNSRTYNYPQLQDIVDSLLDGDDPDTVIDELLNLPDLPPYKPSALYYYYLGLAYELSGDEANAVNAYLTAWQDYCCDNWQIFTTFTTANPYAIMAQAKLIPQ